LTVKGFKIKKRKGKIGTPQYILLFTSRFSLSLIYQQPNGFSWKPFGCCYYWDDINFMSISLILNILTPKQHLY
jgi:hypothetical protein